MIAEEYIAKLKDEGAAESTLDKNAWLLLDLAACLRNRPIAELTPAEILTCSRGSKKAAGAIRRVGCAASSAACAGTPW